MENITQSKRVIPCLLLSGDKLVKTKKFKNPVYLGDPINAVRIFNDKEVDELILLDIDATVSNREPNYELISEIAGECFMPLAYGGGISSSEQVIKLIRSGVEKVVVNSAACDSLDLIRKSSEIFGSQAIIACVDLKKKILGGYRIYSHSGTRETELDLYNYLDSLVDAGVGEIMVNSIDRDGLMNGYDLNLIGLVAGQVNIPVIASGGAGSVDDFRSAIKSGASAVAAGSFFVFYGKHKAVLINYPRNLSL